MTAIRVTDLVHRYRDGGTTVNAVDHVSFEVAEDEFYTLLGPSGCGKTTTLRCVAGLEQPTSGEIQLDDVVVFSSRGTMPTHRRNIGMVFQDYALWPHMSVFDNVAFPLKIGPRMSRTAISDRVHEALELVGMDAYANRRPSQLSGGQQQRASLARALVRKPRVLLLDEPLSNLDAKLRAQMRKELSTLQRQIKVATIFVTQVEALSMSTSIAVMNQGRIVQVGPPQEIYRKPNSEFVASFVGSTTFLPGTVEENEPHRAGRVLLNTAIGRLSIESTLDVQPGEALTIAVRPESLSVSAEQRPDTNSVEGVVEVGLFVGHSYDLDVSVGETVLRVRGDRNARFGRGDRVWVEIPPDEGVLITPSIVTT